MNRCLKKYIKTRYGVLVKTVKLRYLDIIKKVYVLYKGATIIFYSGEVNEIRLSCGDRKVFETSKEVLKFLESKYKDE